MRDGKKICIVGPGRMGVGIVTAILLANQGHAVTLFDTKERYPGQEMIALEKALCEIRNNMILLSELGMWGGDSEQACTGVGECTLLKTCLRSHVLLWSIQPGVCAHCLF